jgi:predicted RNase H-like HicB family nuclease
MLTPSRSLVQHGMIVIRTVGQASESSCAVGATLSPMRYLVVITEDPEDAGYNASCPGLPGCHSEGATIEEAMDGIREAIACYIKSLALDDLPAPGAAPVIAEVEIV